MTITVQGWAGLTNRTGGELDDLVSQIPTLFVLEGGTPHHQQACIIIIYYRHQGYDQVQKSSTCIVTSTLAQHIRLNLTTSTRVNTSMGQIPSPSHVNLKLCNQATMYNHFTMQHVRYNMVKTIHVCIKYVSVELDLSIIHKGVLLIAVCSPVHSNYIPYVFNYLCTFTYLVGSKSTKHHKYR